MLHLFHCTRDFFLQTLIELRLGGNEIERDGAEYLANILTQNKVR